jgi:hypothetical protein
MTREVMLMSHSCKPVFCRKISSSALDFFKLLHYFNALGILAILEPTVNIKNISALLTKRTQPRVIVQAKQKMSKLA